MLHPGLLRRVGSLARYHDDGGGQGLAAAASLGHEAVIREVEASGLRGRGGCGFPTGRKWRSVRDCGGGRRFVVANGVDGEPGTFKDRAILRANPYQVIEGLAIAAIAIGATEAYIAIKASYARERAGLERAAREMTAAGLLEGTPVRIVTGPDEYLFGEERALLEVIEGHDPFPRVLPPHRHGLFATMPQRGGEADLGANPTLVNNVETLAHASTILARGAAWFRSRGTARSPGTMVFTVVGDVARPGVHELPLGTPLRVLVEDLGGGTASGRPVKMVCSGVANGVMRAGALDLPMDFDGLANAAGGLGSGGFVVYGDDVCALAVARAYSNFLWIESCGQCPACKLGTGAITSALAGFEAGGDAGQLAVLQRALNTVTDGRRCAIPVEEQQMVGSLLRTFPDDVLAHEGTGHAHASLRHHIVVPKIVDLDDGVVTYDRLQTRKQPDWTYATPAA